MGHKSANDGITRRNKEPLVLARRGTQPETFRKLISFAGLASQFIIWILFHVLGGTTNALLCGVTGTNPLRGECELRFGPQVW